VLGEESSESDEFVSEAESVEPDESVSDEEAAELDELCSKIDPDTVSSSVSSSSSVIEDHLVDV
jgi:hypothetical protein